MTSLTPGEEPSWSEGPTRCPRCGCQETTLDEVQPRFLLLAFLKSTTCNRCKYQFSARTGIGILPILVVVYVAPFGLIALTVTLVLLLAG